MKRLLLALPLAALTLAPDALACSCACNGPGAKTASDWTKDAAYIFKGEVLSATRVTDSSDSQTFVMKLLAVSKGAPVKELTILSPRPDGMCGVGFQRGEVREVIATRAPDGRLWTNTCSQYCAAQAGVFKQLDAKTQVKP